MSAFGDALRSLARVLEAERVPWYLFGAQAVALRGAPRATQDLDVTIRVDRAHLPALAEHLAREGLTHRFPELAERLLRDAAVVPLVHGPTGFEVDLVVAGAGLEDLALSRATVIPVEGVPVPVASATDLVVMKVLAGRGKDLDDAAALLAAGQVDEAEVHDLLGQLEEALGQSDLVPAFARICRRS